jgi:hypothetical protein
MWTTKISKLVSLNLGGSAELQTPYPLKIMSDKLSHLLACCVLFSPTTHASMDISMHAQMLHFFKLAMYNVRDAVTSGLTAHKHTVLYNAR